jgi:hypothetical protein
MANRKYLNAGLPGRRIKCRPTDPSAWLGSFLLFACLLVLSKGAAFAVTAIPAPNPILQMGGTVPGSFGEVTGVALDASGNIYVADPDNQRIQVFDSQGNYLSQFPVAIYPYGIAIANGIIYLAGQYGPGRDLLEYDLAGNPIGPSFQTPGSNVSLNSVAVDPSGNIYVIESSHGAILKYAPNGTQLSANFGNSTGVAVATDSNYVYLTTCGQGGLTIGRVQKFDFNGNLISQWTTPLFTCGVGVAVDSSGDVRIADYDSHQVLNFTNSGTLIFQTGSIGQGQGQFYHPTGVVVNSQGQTIVADEGNSRVVFLDASGNFLSAFGKSGLYGYYNNIGMASTPDGHIYVVDSLPPFGQPTRFSTFDSQGNLTFRRFFADVLPPNTNWPQPTSLAVGPDGSIYVDFAGHPANTCANPVIAKFDTQLNKLATTSSGCDVGAPTFPTITTDTLGLVYFNEGGNIKVFDSNLNLTSQFAPASSVDQNAIAVDSQGLIYLITPSGALALFDGPSNPIGFVHGVGGNILATAPDRSLFIADSNTDALSVYPSASATAQLSWNLPYTPDSAFVDQSKVYVVGEAGGAAVNPVALFVYSNVFVSSVTPPTGGDTGQVTLTISGRGFQQGATVLLRRTGQADIVANAPTFSSDGTSATAQFNVAGAADGAWDLVVLNADGTSASSVAAFTIRSGGGPNLWVQVVGREFLKVGSPSTFDVVYGNSGSGDAYDVLLVLTVPTALGFNLDLQPPNLPGVDFNSIPWGSEYDESGVPVWVVPIWTYRIPPSTQLVVPVTLNPSTSQTLGVTAQLWQSQPNDFTRTGDFSMIGESPIFSTLIASYDLLPVVGTSPQLTTDEFKAALPSWLQAHSDSVVMLPYCTLAAAATAGVGNIALSERQEMMLCDPFPPGQSPGQYIGPPGTARAGILYYGVYCGPGDNCAPNTRLTPQCPSCDPLDAACEAHDSCYDGCEAQFPKQFGSWVHACFPNPQNQKNPSALCQCLINCNAPLCNEATIFQPASDTPQQQSACMIPDESQTQFFQRANTYSTSVLKNFCESGGFLSSVLFLLTEARALFVFPSSRDPNSKTGPSGGVSLQWVSGRQPVSYSVLFTNESTATAPAQKVIITDQLDLTKLDPSSFSFGPIAYGSNTVSPALGQNPYGTQVDLRPAQNLIVRISAQFNSVTGLATWTYQSIDPTTGLPPTDPTVGFLPPDTSPPNGEGSVIYSVKPLGGLPSGTVVSNTATIVFDQNAPISTQPWSNTLDSVPPTSHVNPLPATENTASFLVNWSGTDDASGLQSFTLWVSDNGGPFTIWESSVSETSDIYPGVVGHTYAFYSIAQDNAGNTEAAKTQAEATTTVSTNSTPIAMCQNVTVPTDPNVCTASNASINNGSSDPDADTLSFSQSPSSPYNLGATPVTLTVTDSANLTATCTGTVNVVDKQPPTISSVAASPNVLWPPNNKLVPVTVSVSATDNCTPNPVCNITAIASNEPISSGDTQITGNLTANLRAQRLGSGTGRIYTLTVQCTDGSGNASSAPVTVEVPHDQGQ